MTDVGPTPNHPTESHIPINIWNLWLLEDGPASWVVALDIDGQHYKLPKWRGVYVPSDEALVKDQINQFSIPITVAQDCGLLPSDISQVAPAQSFVAEQITAFKADQARGLPHVPDEGDPVTETG